MLFEQIATGGCQSYLVGCAETCAAALIDPEVSQIDRYLALAARDGLRIRFLIDTYTELARQLSVPVVMHRASPAPFVAEVAAAGPAHAGPHRRFDLSAGRGPPVTGDTLLNGATGRTDLPSGDGHQLAGALRGQFLKGLSGVDSRR